LAATANPASKACRITYNQRKVGYVPGHDCSGTYHREPSDLKSGKNSCIGANTAALFEQRLNAFPFGISASRPKVVHKNGGRTDENIVFRYQAIPKKHTGFEGDAIAQADLPFNKGMVADIAVLTHDSALENVSKSPHPRA
jgi:hypothetical protein